MRDKARKTDFERRLYNPNLLPREIKSQHGDTDNHKIFFQKYKDALKQTSWRQIAYGLEADHSDTDVGFGGFYESGFMSPEFLGGKYADIGKNWEKEFKFYWPKDIRTGKYMSYLASINLGNWPFVFRDYTLQRSDNYYCNISLAGGRDLWGDNFEEDSDDVWLHFFVGEDYGDFETMVPDCHVRMTRVENVDRMDDWRKKFTLERRAERTWTDQQVLDKMKEWQETMCVKRQITGKAKFFGNPQMHFKYDGVSYNQWDKETGIFEYRYNDIDLYGVPRSQQEPRRYLSFDSFFPRGLTPIFSFSDAGTDMTHQFYVDTLQMDAIRHKSTYCKLDSSCT